MIGKTTSLLRAVLFLCVLSSAQPVFAQSDEEEVGSVAAARIMGSAPLIDAPNAQRYVNLVGASVARKADAPYKWRFGLIKTDSVNAFATPGGFVLVTAGLVRSLESEDELAFVLAHEIAHVLQRHHYRVIVKQRLAEQAMKSVQAASGYTQNAALSQASAQLFARGLDKSSEYEADRIGIELMTEAGYDPAAAIGVLERLQKLKGDDPRAELLFATHPSAFERMDVVFQSGIEQLPRPAIEGVNRRTNRFKQFLASFQ